MNGPMLAICRKIASRRVTNLFFIGFMAFMINMYIYVLIKATKKSPATTFFAAGASLHSSSPLNARYPASPSGSKVRQFRFSELLMVTGRRGQ